MTTFCAGRGSIARSRTAGGGGGSSLEIINAGSGGVWSTSGTPNNWTWTTAADTTLLVAVCILGANENNNANDFSALTFNGDAMTEIGRHENSSPAPYIAAPGQQWFYLVNPDIGASLALAPTLNGWAGGPNPANNATQIFLFNLKGEHGTPIGASDFPDTESTGASKSDSITSQFDNSILLSCGSVNNGTNGISPLESLAELAEQATGGSISVDITSAIGWKQLGTAGAYGYGWSFSSADGNGISAVEIRPA